MHRYKIALVEFNIRNHESGVGGADKGKNGHRVDSIPIANGVIKAGSMCFPIKYLPEKHDEFTTIVKCFDGIIVRINPGQMEPPVQAKFDTLMVSIHALVFDSPSQPFCIEIHGPTCSRGFPYASGS